MADSFDFPAAHSMDTRWFAIDRDGHVALFDSGEGGAVPETAGNEDGGFASTERLLGELGATKSELEDVLAVEPDRLGELGLYFYSCDGGMAEPYERIMAPDQPVASERVKQLVKPVATFGLEPKPSSSCGSASKNFSRSVGLPMFAMSCVT